MDNLGYRSLRRVEAEQRAALLAVDGYEIDLDLSATDDADATTFGSRTVIRFTSERGRTFCDVRPVALHAASLDGQPLNVDDLERGRLPLDLAAGSHELVLTATMPLRSDGEGLHRHVDPADGRTYLYQMSFMDAASTVFACFDQPDLKAPVTLLVSAPTEWSVTANGIGEQVEPGRWHFAPTPPLSTYFVTLIAGPYHHLSTSHDGIRLGLSCRASIAIDLDADAEELFTLTRQCFDEYHRLFGIRYPFGDYHQAFVPEFNAGAMENPGCVTFRDPLVFTSRVTRGARIQRATTLAHEMAHQWFGNLVTPRWWDDLWLNESFAEYLGNRVTAEVTEYGDAWVHNAHRRRQWGLVADQRPTTHPVAGNGADDALGALQDFDGISYAKGSSVLKQLAATVGDDVFFRGVIDHFTAHRFGNATMHDLFSAWERAGAGDLDDFIQGWLRTAGVDLLQVERDDAGGPPLLRRVPPAEHPASRRHTLRVASAETSTGPGEWRITTVELADDIRLDVAGESAITVDAFEDSWSLSAPDETTCTLLETRFASTSDPLLRAGIWNSVRSGVHTGALSAGRALDLVAAGLPSEQNDDGFAVVATWALERLGAVLDPLAVAGVVAAAAEQSLGSAVPGETLHLAAFSALVAATTDLDRLARWRAGELPDGIETDEAMRWRVLLRSAVLDAVDDRDLDAALAAAPSAVARVEHSRARAARPSASAKAWAWSRLREPGLSNYEIEAAGRGLWQHGQQSLTVPYLQRYCDELPELAGRFSGWLANTVASAYFPITCTDEASLAALESLLAGDALPATLRRPVGDNLDELRRRVRNAR